MDFQGEDGHCDWMDCNGIGIAIFGPIMKILFVGHYDCLYFKKRKLSPASDPGMEILIAE